MGELLIMASYNSYELPEGPTLNPVNPIDPGLAKFVWNMNANDIYNAAKAPIQGQTFGVSNTTLLLVGGLVIGLGLLAGRR